MYQHVDFSKVSDALTALFHFKKMFWGLKKIIYNHYILKITFKVCFF